MSSLIKFFILLSLANGQYSEDTAQAHLEYACQFTGGECPAEAPRALTVPMRPHGLYFHGTDVVFITDRCIKDNADQDFCSAVLVHEMVHYIVNQQGRYRGIPCANEQLAWAAYNRTVIAFDRYDLYRGDWREAYPKCQASD